MASHGLFDVHVKAKGDTHIDDHHTNEDVGLAIGTVGIIRSSSDFLICSNVVYKELLFLIDIACV